MKDHLGFGEFAEAVNWHGSAWMEWEGVLGSSLSLERIRCVLLKAISNDLPVLIAGETGTGKDWIARTLHSMDRCPGSPLVRVDCSTWLGGRGSVVDDMGLCPSGTDGSTLSPFPFFFRKAKEGTLIFRELAKLPLAAQEVLVRFLENEKEQGEPRVIATMSDEPGRMLKEGRLRQDLFYQFQGLLVSLPPLRKEKETVRDLVWYHLRRCSRENGKRIDGITQQAMEFLVHYSWPGNVRELVNAMERVVIMTKDSMIGIEDLEFLGSRDPLVEQQSLDEVVREHIARVIRSQGGNISKAAAILGIHRSTLHKKIRRYRIAVRMDHEPSRSVLREVPSENKEIDGKARVA